MPSKNELAATLPRSEAARAGVMDAPAVQEHITVNSKKQYGFTRKQVPQDLPTEPKLYIFSISDYGEKINLGPGFKQYEVHACPTGMPYGNPCVIDPIIFFEEAKVDVTEHTFHSGHQIADAIMKIGPGMHAAWDRRKVGWLISHTNPPTEHELKVANAIFGQECQRLFNEGNRYFAANQLNEINETHRRAATHMGQKVDWDKPQYKMVECVGCKERIREGSIVHAVSHCGAVQPGKWPEAISFGMKRLEDAPSDIRELLDTKQK